MEKISEKFGIIITEKEDCVSLYEPQLGTTLVKTKPPQFKVTDFRTVDLAMKELKDLYQTLYLKPLIQCSGVSQIRVVKQNDSLFYLVFGGKLGSNKIQSVTSTGKDSRIVPLSNTTIVQLWFTHGFANILPMFPDAMVTTKQSSIVTSHYAIINIRSLTELKNVVCLLTN